ncbi:MAG: site-2 protease family protein [Lawsonibacter sp.]
MKVNEFAIGMGPCCFPQKGETAVFPPRHPHRRLLRHGGGGRGLRRPQGLFQQAGWKKFIILVAGAFMNFLTGLVIILVLLARRKAFDAGGHRLFMAAGLWGESAACMAGDRILSGWTATV